MEAYRPIILVSYKHLTVYNIHYIAMNTKYKPTTSTTHFLVRSKRLIIPGIRIKQ